MITLKCECLSVQVSAFGEGTYLSSELSLCLMYSQAGEGWKHSQLGTKLSCVAVCQMIDDPSVKCQIKEGELVCLLAYLINSGHVHNKTCPY